MAMDGFALNVGMRRRSRNGRQQGHDLQTGGDRGEGRRYMIAIYTQNRQAVWNFADISRFHVNGNGTGIQAVAKNGAGGELARYKNREQCTYVLEMLMSAFDADERTFTFPAEKELEHVKQHGATGGGKRHGGS